MNRVSMMSFQPHRDAVQRRPRGLARFADAVHLARLHKRKLGIKKHPRPDHVIRGRDPVKTGPHQRLGRQPAIADRLRGLDRR